MSSSSTSSSSRGMPRMNASRPPQARCASSASISHISSNLPSACRRMKRISNVAGAIDVGGGGRSGSIDGGSVAIAPAMPVPIEALTNRPKSSAGHVVNCPAMRVSTASTAGNRRIQRTSLLTNDARCCVMSPDCIQNVDNSQPLAFFRLPWSASGTSSDAPSTLRLKGEMDVLVDDPHPSRTTDQKGQAVIRIGVSAWRVAPRTQPAAMRRTIAATSPSGTPTGQAAAAASKSGPSPSISEDASPTRA